MAIYLVVYSLMGLLPILISKIVSEKNRTKWYVWMAFILLFLLFALRNPNMGVDLGYGNSTGYLASFKQLNSYSWDKIFTLDGYQNYEWGYIIFNKVIHKSYKTLCNSWASKDKVKFEEACWVNLMMVGVAYTDPDRKH